MTDFAAIVRATRSGRNGLQVVRWVMDHAGTRRAADCEPVGPADRWLTAWAEAR